MHASYLAMYYHSTAFSNAFLDKVLILFGSGSRPMISWCTGGFPLFAPVMIGAVYLIFYDTAYLDLLFDSLTVRLFTVAFPARQTQGVA